MNEHETDLLVERFLTRAGTALRRDAASPAEDAEEALLARCASAAKVAYLGSPSPLAAPPGAPPADAVRAPLSSGVFRLGAFGGGILALGVAAWVAIAPAAAPPPIAAGPGVAAPATPVSPAASTTAAVEASPILTVDVASLPTVTVGKGAPQADPSGPSAAELFSRANAARREHDDARAIALYEALIATHPRASEASVATITLGRLHLERGAPERALPHFESASASSAGVLREEAMIGRARCYERLGRTAEERRAWNALLEAFPSTVARPHALERIAD